MKLLRTHLYLEQSQIVMDICTLIAGLLLPLAFAPYNIYLLAFICPLIWLIGLRDSTNKRALWRGWLFGFGFFTIGVSWLYISIHSYGNTPAIIAALLTFLFVAGLAFIFSLQAFFYVYFFARKHWLNLSIGFACCWALAEIFRSWILTGFPWLLLGNSQIHSWLSGYAPLISVYGVSFIVASISGLVLNALQNIKHFLLSVVGIIVLLVVGFVLSQLHWTHPVGNKLSVSLIQGNIPQSIKWDPQHLSLSLSRYQQLAAENWQSQLIVFPEGAIPDSLTNQQTFFETLDQQAKYYHSGIIGGVVLINPITKKIYNGITAFGNANGFYLKRHLVPFGEYVPLQHLLRGLINFFNLPMSNFSAGALRQPLLQINNIKIAPFLCYEIAYLNLMLPALPQAQLLMTLSDDSWFGDSSAAAQQLQISQMRSLEAGREQIVVGNNGFTAIINATGKLVKLAPRNKVFVLRGTIQPRQGSTPLVHFGWLSEFIALLILTLTCWLITRRHP